MRYYAHYFRKHQSIIESRKETFCKQLGKTFAKVNRAVSAIAEDFYYSQLETLALFIIGSHFCSHVYFLTVQKQLLYNFCLNQTGKKNGEKKRRVENEREIHKGIS